MVLIYEVPPLVETQPKTNDYTIREASSAQGDFHICTRPSIATFPGWPAKAQGGLDWILGKNSLLKEWSDIRIGCPARWLSPRPWKCLKNV